MSSGLIVTVDYKPVTALFAQFGKYANQEANRTYKRIASKFMKEFTRKRIRKGIFNPVRKVKIGKTTGGNPTIPKKAKKAGFKAVLGGRKRLAGKYVRVYTSNPLILMREAGGIIKPKRGKWIVIRGSASSVFGRAKKNKNRRENWQKWAAKQQHGGGYAKPVLRKARSAGPFPKLRFEASWRVWHRRELSKLLEEIPRGVVRRAERKLRRGVA